MNKNVDTNEPCATPMLLLFSNKRLPNDSAAVQMQPWTIVTIHNAAMKTELESMELNL